MPEMIILLGSDIEKEGFSTQIIQFIPEDISREEAERFLEEGLANLIPKEDWNPEWIIKNRIIDEENEKTND